MSNPETDGPVLEAEKSIPAPSAIAEVASATDDTSLKEQIDEAPAPSKDSANAAENRTVEKPSEADVSDSPNLKLQQAENGADEHPGRDVPGSASTRQESASAEETRTWDHSNRRVIVLNVLKYLDKRDVKKMTDKWLHDLKEKNPDGPAIEFDKLKKPPKDSWLVVTLKEESMVQPFIEYINNNDITNKRGGKLHAKRPDDMSNERKRKKDDARDDRSKRQRIEDKQLPARRPISEEEIKDKITPLWRMSNEEQLDRKMKQMIRKCAMKTVQEIKGRFRTLSKAKDRKQVNVYSWLEKKRCIDVQNIVSAPTPLRNKCEFTFGYRYLFDQAKSENATTDTDAVVEPPKIPAVGFMATGWAGGVVRPHCCENIPTETCALVDIVDDFLLKSQLPPYDPKGHRGFWRTMTVRSSRRTEECMVIVLHSPPSGGAGDKDDSGDYSGHVEKEKARLIAALTNAELPVPEQEPLKVTSIFFQEFDGLSSPTPDHPVQHAYGKTTLLERLGECTFQISPGAFFQTNTEGAEILYQLAVDKIREVSEDPATTILFDVCCGTGTIGLTCMKEGAVGGVVGIDISEPAIEDAEKNAELNGFGADGESNGNTRFVAARAEEVLSKEIFKATSYGFKFVAVVDPAREGLHPDVVKTLRSNDSIQRIVYVSCNPLTSLVRDAALFCAPPTKRYRGRAFRITSALPVDMFPLTDHCEMVMTFDRVSDVDMDGEQ